MCGEVLQFPLDKKGYHIFFNLDECGDDFYFNNVVRYLEDIIADVEKLEMDSQYKREIIINSKMAILSAELCKVRKNETINKQTAEKLIKLIDWMHPEFEELWKLRNYTKGSEVFLKILEDRRTDIVNLLSSGDI